MVRHCLPKVQEELIALAASQAYGEKLADPRVNHLDSILTTAAPRCRWVWWKRSMEH
jgi:hypothetical protein